MAVRRVVTGHTPEGHAVFVSDEEVQSIPIGDGGSASTLIWHRDEPGQFPDDGSQPAMSAIFPPPGGCSAALMEIGPDSGEFHGFVNAALAPWADPGEPGMHRTATIDYDIVLQGTIGLELDNGAEVTLAPGDVVVQNGTRHRWHNRGEGVARLLSVTVGAHNALEGGRPAAR
jgi:mannose-6-phosphate isomerase-like protein (cupin superfamily)